MRKATRLVALFLGAAAGIAGIEHGVFEILQGNTRPDGLFIASIGPPCVPEEVWNACEPALTIIPNFLVTGILATLLGLAVLVWSVGFVQRRAGGPVLIGLSIALLLFGGGLFPPLIGVIGGVTALWIHRPVTGSGRLWRRTAVLWPWPLVILMTWLWGQFVVGYFFNDFLQSVMGFGVILILALLPLSVMAAYAHDAHAAM